MSKGGGGGGGAGAVDYPDYMETFHGRLLDNSGADSPTNSVIDAINAAYGSSPWTGEAAYDPDADITALEAAISGFDAIIGAIVDTTAWAALYTQAATSITIADEADSSDEADIVVADMDDSDDVDGIAEAEIVADVDAFADNLDDEITTKVLPRFQSGMRDINAVVSSAFVLGEAIIEGFRDREVAKHESTLRLSAAHKNADIELANEQLHHDVRKTNLSKDITVATKNADIGIQNEALHVEIKKLNLGKDINLEQIRTTASNQLLQLMVQRINWEENYMKTVIEGKRIKIVAKKEQIDIDLKIEENDNLWDLEVFQYGANLLAAIGGGTVGTKSNNPSTTQSVLGGALSGAAAGAMLGFGLPGALIGGLLGAATGFL